MIDDSSRKAVRRAPSRRSLLRAGVGGALIAAAPAVVSRRARAAKPLKVAAFTDYISTEMIAAFKARTGIVVALTESGDDQQFLSQLENSEGASHDVVFNSSNTILRWYAASDAARSALLAPIDESRLDRDEIIPAIWERSGELGAVRRGRRFAVPFNWGTEVLVYDSDERKYEVGSVSWKDQWALENQGRVAVRPFTALTSIALMQGGGGKLDAAHRDRFKAREMFEQAIRFAIQHHSWVRATWTTREELRKAYFDDRCVVGQSYESIAIELWKATRGRLKFVAPKDGALAWMDTISISARATNTDAIYAFLNFCLSPEGGAMHTRATGYNSAAVGAKNLLGAKYRERYASAYGRKGEAIENFWWQRLEPEWYVALRDEYVARWGLA